MTPRSASDPLAAAPFPQLARLAGSGRLPQSLLLTGPPGAPTADAAIALAAIVNSPDRDPASPATRDLEQRIRRTEEAARAGGSRKAADGWQGPGPGPYPDVKIVRPEAGKLIRVEAIREAIAATRTHPFEGRRRVLIIVDADTMNPSGANALLKTLEEPHDWLGLILCAVREAALLPTIVSRCQRWRFRAPTSPEVAARLREHHDYDVDEAAIAAAASRADLDLALAFPRERLAALAETAEKFAAAVGQGIPPAVRAALTDQLARRAPRTRKAGDSPDEIQALLALVRASLRDLAALRSGAAPLLGHRKTRLEKIAGLAPGDAFAEAFLLVEDADRNLRHHYANRKMQLDDLLLAFNDIARPLVIARMRQERAARR